MAGKGQPKTGGRRKGSPNKTTADLRDAYLRAFVLRGGVEELVSLAPEIFYAGLHKLLPREVKAELAGGAQIVVRIERSFVADVSTGNVLELVPSQGGAERALARGTSSSELAVPSPDRAGGPAPCGDNKS